MKKKLQPAITLLQQYMAQDMTVYAGHATLFLLTAFFPLLMWLLVVVNTLPGFTVDSVVELFFRFLPDIPVIRDTIASLITSMNENSNTFVGIAGRYYHTGVGVQRHGSHPEGPAKVDPRLPPHDA